MYEAITYESLLNRMLAKVPDDMDKREGSIIYDALAPCALELIQMYIELGVIMSETFADTASREYLIRRAKERGIEPFMATYSLIKGEFDVEIEIGSRFTCDNLYFYVVEKIEDTSGHFYSLKCESNGTDGNINSGELMPISYIDKLGYAKVDSLIIPARNEEDTEVFRSRYMNSFQSEAFGGNIEDYLQRTNIIEGVGATKVTPTWNGGGTVKLTIIDAVFNPCTPEVVEKVQEIIDPIQDGHGAGIAPIGHIVTVESVTSVPININTNIVCVGEYTFEDIESDIILALEKYFLTLRQTWHTISNITVRISQIEAIMLNVEKVLDISNTMINDSAGNIILSEYEVPVLGGVENV